MVFDSFAVMSPIKEIQADINVIESDQTLRIEVNFGARVDAIDFIEFHILDRLEGLMDNATEHEGLLNLKQQAEKIKRELEQVDYNLFKKLREDIRTGTYTGPAFIDLIAKYIGSNAAGSSKPRIGYDNLDVFIDYLLLSGQMPEETMKREAGMVFYQKTPARVVFEMAALGRIKPGDVFFDLGSGLGQVAILINLISGAESVGVEYEPAYQQYATDCADSLSLSNVHFINKDARDADYSRGTVFFLYTPFEGSILESVLNSLRLEAENRAIRIFTYGPCSVTVADQQWLTCVKGVVDDPYQLCEFKVMYN